MFSRPAFLGQKIKEIIVSSKEKYYNLGSKLNNPRSHCKTYWSLLKTLINGKRVPPIQIGDKIITNFKEKAKAFNDYFGKQCRKIDNNS